MFKKPINSDRKVLLPALSFVSINADVFSFYIVVSPKLGNVLENVKPVTGNYFVSCTLGVTRYRL